ncbi:MAG: hypothetical protein NVSMB64_26710 [Candidatus Velthaea sp.]
MEGVLRLADTDAAKGRHVAACVQYAIAWVGGVRRGLASRRLILAAHRGLIREALEADQAAVDAVANSDGPDTTPMTTVAAAPQPKSVVAQPDSGTPSIAATCSRLARRFSATKNFADASADELRQIASGKTASAWIAEAQAADNAGSTAVACVGYMQGAAAYRADGNAAMANIWGIEGVGRSTKVADSQPESQSSAARPFMASAAPIGRYGCSSFQSTYMTLSSMPEMRITSATRYAALGGYGTFTAEAAQRPDLSIDGLLRFRTGPLAGKYADAVRQERGTRALVFSKGQLDTSSTVCALQAK